MNYRKAHYQQDREYRIKRAIERSKEDPEARRDQQRASRLKVPVAQVRLAIARCNGKCECCSMPLSHREMCVDHDHETGKIRGVLCLFCNALEGMLNKKKERVQQLLSYLERCELSTEHLSGLKASNSLERQKGKHD